MVALYGLKVTRCNAQSCVSVEPGVPSYFWYHVWLVRGCIGIFEIFGTEIFVVIEGLWEKGAVEYEMLVSKINYAYMMKKPKQLEIYVTRMTDETRDEEEYHTSSVDE